MSVVSNKRRSTLRRLYEKERQLWQQEANRRWSANVFISDTPPEWQYTCPNCNKGVHCFRIGNSASYWVMNADDTNKDHNCLKKGQKGFDIPNKLSPGYKEWVQKQAAKEYIPPMEPFPRYKEWLHKRSQQPETKEEKL